MTEGIAASTAPIQRTRTPAVLAWRLAPVAVALGSLGIGVAALGHRSLTTDEAASVAQARGSIGAVLSTAVERARSARETVVVVPERSRAAFAYYAPYVSVIRYARGEGAWVAVVASTHAGAITAARPSVRTPTYALLRQFRYGDGLRLQHWVRP